MTDTLRGNLNRAIEPKAELNELLRELRPQLPIQNPIPFFVHNNPIQYWEKYKFDQGITFSSVLYERAGISLDRNFAREFEDLVIPVISSYLDQGMSKWKVNSVGDSESLWDWFIDFIKHSLKHKSKLISAIKEEFSVWSCESSEDFVCRTLIAKFGAIKDSENCFFHVKSVLFHLKGWSGIVNLFESNPRLYPLKQKKIALIDWLAILLLVEDKMAKLSGTSFEVDINLRQKRSIEIQNIISEIKKNESSYYHKVLEQFKAQLVGLKQPKRSDMENPYAQVFFCIDDREEALRRNIKLVNPKIETFGTVGFYGIDVAIKSHDQSIFQPFCPPVIQPRKRAVEVLVQKKRYRDRLIKGLVSAFNHTRFTLHEPIVALFAPAIYLATLLLRSLQLRWYQNLSRNLLNTPDKAVGLNYEFEPGFAYSIDEKVKIVGDILKSAGLKTAFSPVVIIMGHGATTTNNPFQKSYGCGACSGQSGFPNAKIFCTFANDEAVREKLRINGYQLPSDTIFVAAHHDTCSDELIIADDIKMNSHQVQILQQVRKDFSKALSLTTRERFSRFGIDPTESPLNRSLDWSQPRPEYGHSKVALSIFGPRILTEGMNLNGRSFLISYDPETDLDGSELEFVINNALPVCANINLDYFTSRAFPEAFGSGSKLPMNIVSGIGLMTGSKGDLRIGLARQMVDQHEPLRLLSLVYCKKEHLEKVISKSIRLKNIISNEWIHLVRIDPVDFSLEPVTQEIAKILKKEDLKDFAGGFV